MHDCPNPCDFLLLTLGGQNRKVVDTNLAQVIELITEQCHYITVIIDSLYCYFVILIQAIQLFTIYRDIKGEQKIFREFSVPRPFGTFLIILHHELVSDARLSKKSRKVEVRKIL